MTSWTIGRASEDRPGLSLASVLLHSVILVYALAIAGCRPYVGLENLELDRECLERIAEDASRNPRTNTFSYDLARELRLTSLVDPDRGPYRVKQVEFFQEGYIHYFSVDSSNWTKATLSRISHGIYGQDVQIFVVSRDGSLLAAARLTGNSLENLDIHRPDVQAEFNHERNLWAERGPPGQCRM